MAGTTCVRVFAVLSVLLCLGVRPLSAGDRVRAKGTSFFEPGRELIAREKALEQAKRAAVEQAVGAVVESRVATENARVIRDQILSRSSGYLTDVRIVAEQKSPDGLYEVTIEAQVETAKMEGDLERFRQLVKWQKNPRVAVVVDSTGGGEHLAAAQKAVALLTDKLKQSGFTVLRHSPASREQTGLLVALSVAHAATTSNYQGLELTLNEVSLSADIYRPGDQTILATAGAVKSVPGDNRLKVIDKAVRQCVEGIWRELSTKLARVWEEELYGVRDLMLIVRHIPSYEKALEIEQALKSDISGVAGVSLVRFEREAAHYDLQYRGWPEQLSDEIQTDHFTGRHGPSRLESIDGNTIVIRIDPL